MFRLATVAALCLATSVSFSQKICIDAGHGGSDPGALSCNQVNREKDNTLDTCLRFRNWLNADTNDGGGGGSWSTVMTRTTDVYVSLQGRCNISNSNGAARFMCIHNNAFNCSANGTETFCYGSGSSSSFNLRDKVQARMIQAWNRVNRGGKTANFTVLVNTNAPAELAELGFIDSSVDNAYCSNASWRDVAAKYHLFAIQDHYGIPAYTPGSGSHTYINDSPSASGWSVGTSSADKYGANYIFRSTAAISNPASWVTSVPGGSYQFSAWWPAGGNRSTAAPYILPGGANIKVNQQINGGKWNVLGNASVGAGNNTTQLSCWAPTGFVVVADAIRLVGP